DGGVDRDGPRRVHRGAPRRPPLRGARRRDAAAARRGRGGGRVSRLDTMLERLPAPLAIDPGSRLREVLGVVAAELAALDEDRDRIQRSHWVDHAFERDDLAGLGALFAVVPAAWEPLGLFRTRLKATVAALLRGSVTRS